MTKIYAVVFKNEEERIYDFEVFTSLKKAKQYKRYWDAVCKSEDSFKGDTVYIVSREIKYLDYTEAANEKEMELLPY